MSEVNEKNRILSLDALRALAVILMIIFHFSFDLSIFHFVNIDFTRDYFWWIFPRVIVFLFLLAVGGSLAEVNERGRLTSRSVGVRFVKLGSLAIIISVFTYFAFPGTWIYFGTLHCIAICSVMAWPLLRLPKIVRMISCSLITLILWLPVFTHDYIWPWIKLEHPSMDYIPALPWFGIVTLGILCADLGFFHKIERPLAPLLHSRPFAPVLWSGRRSLEIYVAHQPILFGLTWLIHLLVN